MHIVTCGDSWSKGEWNIINNKLNVSHPGINQYFKNDNYFVQNLRGFSNYISINKLKTYLETNSPDIIFYFFTDPFRDLADINNQHCFSNFQHKASNFDDFLNLHKTLLSQSLQLMDELNTKIYVLGGCQRLLKKKFKNIEIIVEAISELVCPEYTHPDYWDSGWTSFLNFEAAEFDRRLFDLIEHHHKLQWNMETDQFANMFRPDGRHPNRHAHFKLFNYLKESIIELK